MPGRAEQGVRADRTGDSSRVPFFVREGGGLTFRPLSVQLCISFFFINKIRYLANILFPGRYICNLFFVCFSVLWPSSTFYLSFQQCFIASFFLIPPFLSAFSFVSHAMARLPLFSSFLAYIIFPFLSSFIVPSFLTSSLHHCTLPFH